MTFDEAVAVILDLDNLDDQSRDMRAEALSIVLEETADQARRDAMIEWWQATRPSNL